MTKYRGPELLTAGHDLHGFDCGDPQLNDWLTRRALRNQGEGTTRTWVITDGTRVVAFYASTSAAIPRRNATKRASRNQPDLLPAVLLARMAVDVEHQQQGLGAAMVKEFLKTARAIAELVGVRIALVHAKHERAASFYQRHGFTPSPIDDLTLMLLIKDIPQPARPTGPQ